MLVAGPWTDSTPPLTGIDRSWWPPGVRTAADDARVAGYASALAFYRGAQWTEAARRGETRLVLNYARTLIRKTASYVFPGPVSFAARTGTDDPAARTAGNRAEQLLAGLGGDLDLGRLDLSLAIDASVLGDAALKVTWNVASGRPRVVAVDPGSLVAEVASDDPRQLEAMTQAYGLTGRQAQRLFPTLNLAGLAAERTYPVVEQWTGTRWTLHIAGQVVQDIANPYGWIPYVVAANSPRPFSYWGESDLADLVDVCRELNQRMTVLARILEVSGAPIAVLENVHGSEGISVGPGAKWELPEGARAYLLDLLQGGSSQVHLAFVDQLFRVLHDLSETPRTAFGDSGRDLSGAALEVEIQPLAEGGADAPDVGRRVCAAQRAHPGPAGAVRRGGPAWNPANDDDLALDFAERPRRLGPECGLAGGERDPEPALGDRGAGRKRPGGGTGGDPGGTRSGPGSVGAVPRRIGSVVVRARRVPVRAPHVTAWRVTPSCHSDEGGI
jgi:hypothetical protein